VTLFNRSGNKRAEPPNSQSILPKPSSCLPMKSFFNSLCTITKAPKKLKAIRNAVDLAMDLLLSSQARKHRRSAYHQFKNTNLRQNYGHQNVAFLLKFIWCKRNDLTTNKLSIFCRLQMLLTMPNLSFHGQRELSTGLKLQQKVQKRIAISNCCPDA